MIWKLFLIIFLFLCTQQIPLVVIPNDSRLILSDSK